MFPQTQPKGLYPGSARLAIVDLATGAVRTAPGHWLALGSDFAWARWLPDGKHLITCTWTPGYLVDSVTLTAKPLVPANGPSHPADSGQDLNFTVAVVPPRR